MGASESFRSPHEFKRSARTGLEIESVSEPLDCTARRPDAEQISGPKHISMFLQHKGSPVLIRRGAARSHRSTEVLLLTVAPFLDDLKNIIDVHQAIRLTIRATDISRAVGVGAISAVLLDHDQ